MLDCAEFAIPSRSLLSGSSSTAVASWASIWIVNLATISSAKLEPSPLVFFTEGLFLETTVELVNSCSRLLDLLDDPQDIPFFGKLIQREIIYRLLQGTQGQRLRAMAKLGDQRHRTA